MAIDLRQPGPTAALLTPVGRGAVATIRVEGPLADLDQRIRDQFHAVSGRSLAELPLNRIALAHWGSQVALREEIVVCRTASDAFEIHCHGGDAAARRILTELQKAGCDVLDWRQQVEQTADTLELDLLDALARATTERTASLLIEQASGLLRTTLNKLIELASEEATKLQALRQLDEMLAWSDFGKHLSQPWKVVLTGRPNVGKSSLVNALLGFQRAIVFDQPGTTRDVVTAETAFEGWPMQLADTAGLRQATEELEAAGIERALNRLQDADGRLVLVDLSQPPTADDFELMEAWSDSILIGHKCDLPDVWQHRLPATAIRVSSVTGQGLDAVGRRLVEQLVPHVPSPGTAVPINQRQVDLLKAARDQFLAGDFTGGKKSVMRVIQDPGTQFT